MIFLRLVEDQPEQALLVAEHLKGMAVVIEQIVAVFLDDDCMDVGGRATHGAVAEARPTVLLRYRALLVVRCVGALVGHFEEQQIRQLC